MEMATHEYSFFAQAAYHHPICWSSNIETLPNSLLRALRRGGIGQNLHSRVALRLQRPGAHMVCNDSSTGPTIYACEFHPTSLRNMVEDSPGGSWVQG